MHENNDSRGRRRSSAAGRAERVNAAAALLEEGLPAGEAARVLAGRLGCSERQARRYVADAADAGPVDVPGEAVPFAVRLPAWLAAAVRAHARSSGRTVSWVAAQALEEFLARDSGREKRR
ncbi:MAG: ribbon-helix-helix protein, CopG family [Actinobacteria bacterium]|nr:ribbon-helix-helix protein, CopG family [Actinomycetota bacterium]